MIKKQKKTKTTTKIARDLGHEPSPRHTRRFKSQHHQNLSLPSPAPVLSMSCSPRLLPYFPNHVLGFWPPYCQRSFVSQSPSFSLPSSLPCLALEQLATPSRPCYIWLGLHFPVENSAEQATVVFCILFNQLRDCLVRYADSYR